MAQYLRPSSDITTNSWTPTTGSTLYGVIDEVSYSDADYIERNALAYCEVALGSGLDPDVSTGHIVRYRLRRTLTNRTLTLVVSLYQGSTLIASWTHANPSNSFTGFDQTLTNGEADSITDYADLRLRFDITSIQNAQVYGQVSWAEMELPDATPKDALTSQDIVSGAAAVDKSTLAQKHVLTGLDMSSIPVVNKTSLGLITSLVSGNVETGIPLIDKPALTRVSNLSAADGLCGVPAIGQSAIAQVHKLSSLEIVQASEVQPSTIGQTHVLVGSHIASASIVDKSIIGRVCNLTTLDVVSEVPVIAKPDITQKHVLYSQPILSAIPIVSLSDIGQLHHLSAMAIVTASEISKADLGLYVPSAVNLISQDIVASSLVEKSSFPFDDFMLTWQAFGRFGFPYLSFPLVASPIDPLYSKSIITGIPVIEKSTLAAYSFAFDLTAQDIVLASLIEKPTIGQVHKLISLPIETDLPVISLTSLAAYTNAFDLVANDIVCSSIVEKSSIGQEHILAAKDIVSGIPSVAKPFIGQVHKLVAENILSVPSLEKATLVALANVFDLVALDIVTGNPTVTKATQTAVPSAYSLTAKNIPFGTPIVSKAALSAQSSAYVLTALGIVSGIPLITKATLTPISSEYSLTARDIVLNSIVEKSSIGQAHVLVSEGVVFGVPVIAPAALVGVVHLVSKNISSIPVVSVSEIGQTHKITSKDISPTPVISASTISRIHNLVAKSISALPPVIEFATLTPYAVDFDLVSKDILLSVVIDQAALEALQNAFDLASKDIVLSSVVDKPTIGQAHVLASESIVTGSLVEKASIGQTHALVSSDILTGYPIIIFASLTPQSSEYSLTSKDIIPGIVVEPSDLMVSTAAYNLGSMHIVLSSVVEKLSIGQTHELDAGFISTTPLVQISQIGIIENLVSQDVVASSLVQKSTIDVAHNLVARNISTAPIIEKAVLGRIPNLSVGDILVQPVITNPVIGQEHKLVAEYIEIVPVVEIPSLIDTVNELDALPIVVPAPVVVISTLGQKHIFSGDDIVQTPEISQPTLRQLHRLASLSVLFEVPLVQKSDFKQIISLAVSDIETGSPVIDKSFIQKPGVIKKYALHWRYDMIQARQILTTAYPVLFFMADPFDHVTGVSGLSPVVSISTNGAPFVPASGEVSEVGNGWYALAGHADDRSAIGNVAIHTEAPGADSVDITMLMVSYDPFWDITNLNNTMQSLPRDIYDELARIPAISFSLPQAGEVNAQAGDTVSFQLVNLGNLTGARKIYFTAKLRKTDTDANSIVQVEKSEGLKTIMAQVAAPGNGSLTVLDEAAGNIQVRLEAADSVKIPEGTYYFDVKIVEVDDEVYTLTQGEITFFYDITKAVT